MLGRNWADKNDHSLAGVQVFLDRNGDGKREFGETLVLTDKHGAFSTMAPAGKSILTFIVPKRFEAIGVFSVLRRLSIGLDTDLIEMRMGITPQI